jgi:hypothetical protein
MTEISRAYRKGILASIETLASPSVQLQYELAVPTADVPFEVAYAFTNRLQLKNVDFVNAFIEQELLSLCELYGMVCVASKAIVNQDCHSMAEVQKVPEWRSVMNFAKDLVVELKRNG